MRRIYHRLVIKAKSAATEIWLADTRGFLVEKAVGELEISLMPDTYVVEFGLGTTNYPISLDKPLELTEERIRSGPTCVRPQVLDL